MKKLRKFIVRRSKWARGGIKGDARLLNTDGNMCCLGFAACQLSRKTRHEMLDVRLPRAIFNGASFLTYVTGDGHVANNVLTCKASSINDDNEISDKMREFRLRRLFRAHGIEVTFVD